MPTPLNLEVTHRSSDIAIVDSEFNSLIDTLRWKLTPRFLRPGRTGWFFFERAPTLVERPDCLFRAAKLKGVGIWNPENGQGYCGCQSSWFFDQPSSPTTGEYEHRANSMHFGFSESGEFQMVRSDRAPFGGITHSRAVREYANGRRLVNHAVPATVPFIVVRYEDLSFHGECLGVAVSLVPDDYPYRCDPLVQGDRGLSRIERKSVERIMYSVSGACRAPLRKSRAELLKFVYEEYGARINGFARAGLHRHAGGPDNVIYSVQRKALLLTDLDSSRELADVPQPIQGLEVLRDVASVMYRLLGRICHPSSTQPLPIEVIIDNNPLAAVIDGFLGSEGGDDHCGLTKALWLAYLPHHFAVQRNREAILTDYAERSLTRWQSVMIQPDLFYILAILLLSRLYADSELAAKWPCGLGYDDLLGKAQRCLGDRFRYLASLLSVASRDS